MTVDVVPGTPEPRCVRVRPDQQLQIINRSNAFGQRGKTITVTWPPFGRRTLAVGRATLFRQDLGLYLATGVHDVGISLYAGGGAEIWLAR